MAKRRSIGDIVALDEALPPLYKPAELYNVPLEMVDAEEKMSNFGNQFYHITVAHPETGERLIVSTGATQIVAVVKAWIEMGKEPCAIMFQKVRNMDWIVSPEDAGQSS